MIFSPTKKISRGRFSLPKNTMRYSNPPITLFKNVSIHEQQHHKILVSLTSNRTMSFILVILIIPSFRRLSDLTENKCWQIKFYFSQIKFYSCQLHSYFSEILFTLRLCLTSSTNKRLIGNKLVVITFDKS